jgi:DNA polymerase III gamma/tau subunit
MINYLEKFKLLNIHIDYDLVNKLCTDIHFNAFDKYLQFIQKKDLLKSTHILLELFDKGYSVMDILNSLFLYLKVDAQIDENIKYKIIPYLCKYIHIFHDIHEDEIELSLFTNNIYKLLNF